MSLSVITIKTPFLSSPLMSFYYKSVNRVSYTRIDISIGGDCLTDIPVDIPADIPTKVR